jgi:hypothetical protein
VTTEATQHEIEAAIRYTIHHYCYSKDNTAHLCLCSDIIGVFYALEILEL